MAAAAARAAKMHKESAPQTQTPTVTGQTQQGATSSSSSSPQHSTGQTSTSEEEDIIVDVEDEIDILAHHNYHGKTSKRGSSDDGIHTSTGSRTTSKCSSEISCSDSANS